MNELLESYLNGNINEVKRDLRDSKHIFSEFFAFYIDEQSPTTRELKLFVTRLTN